MLTLAIVLLALLVLTLLDNADQKLEAAPDEQPQT